MLAIALFAAALTASELTAGEPQVVTEGLVFSEGPLYVTGPGEWLFSDVPESKIYRLDKSVFVENSGGANGLALDAGRVSPATLADAAASPANFRKSRLPIIVAVLFLRNRGFHVGWRVRLACR